MKRSILCEHSIKRAAKRSSQFWARGLAAKPLLREVRRNAIAGLDSRHTLADRNYLADAVRQRNQWQRQTRVVLALYCEQIAIVQRCSAQLDDRVKRLGGRVRPLDLDKRIQSKLVLNLECSHRFLIIFIGRQL